MTTYKFYIGSAYVDWLGAYRKALAEFGFSCPLDLESDEEYSHRRNGEDISHLQVQPSPRR